MIYKMQKAGKNAKSRENPLPLLRRGAISNDVRAGVLVFCALTPFPQAFFCILKVFLTKCMTF
jgi:hypothetical protein